MKVENGDIVTVDYTGTFEDGKVFDTSKGKKPLIFAHGKGEVIKGFENAVLGMQKGKERSITIKPEDGYGTYDEKLCQEVPKNIFGDKVDLKPDITLVLRAPDGKNMLARVTKIEGEKATIDLNHPLAGKTLKFKIKVVDVKKP